MRAEDERHSPSDTRAPAPKLVQLRVARDLGANPTPLDGTPPSPVAPSPVAPSPAAPSPARPSGWAAEAPPPAPRETPLSRLTHDIEVLQALVATWDERERNTVQALEHALDALHKEAFVRLIRALKRNPAAAAALREAATDEVVYGVLRHHQILRASLQERVEEALASVRPLLESHGGDVELVAVELPDVVSVRLLGSCDGCSAAGLTMKAGVETAVQERCPEIRQVRVVTSSVASPGSVQFVSPFAATESAGWAHATALDSIPEGGILALRLHGHSLILSRAGNRVSCFENACAHLGMPIDDGEVAGGVLTCPHHGFRFSLESGECLTVAEVQLQTHAARVRGDDVEVRLS